MGYGDGTFWQDGKRWSYKISIGGKQVKRERIARTKEEAKKHAQGLRRKLLAEASAKGGGGPLTLSDLKAFLVADFRNRDRKPGTFQALKVSWRALEAFFGEARVLSEVTAPEIRRFWSYRVEQRKKPATVRREIAFLKMAFGCLADSDPDYPVPRFPRIEVGNNARAGFFADRADLEEFTRGFAEPLPDLCAFLYWTGWRVQEALGLTWRNIRFDAGEVWLHDSKTRADRVFPFRLAPALEEILERQRARTDALEIGLGRVIPWVWHRRGQQVRRFDFTWRTARGENTSRVPHDFRRSAVRNLERAGVPQSVGMALVGIRSAQVYARYARSGRADLDGAAKKLAGLWQAEKGRRAKGTVRKLYGGKRQGRGK